MIPFGRRLSMILTSLVGIAGVSLTMIFNFYILLVGRVLLGFAAGSQGAIAIRMIGEYLPKHMKRYGVGIFMVFSNLSSLIALFSGLILPKNTDTEALKDNKTWRIIFAVPYIFYTALLFGFLVVMRQDSPKYYISKGDRQAAIKAIHWVYKTDGKDYLAERIISDFEKDMNSGACGGNAQKATLK